MSKTVISIENISKSYQLGTINTGTFYGDLKRWLSKQRGLPDPYLKIGEVDHGNRQGETLWALKDINLEVHQGEVLGIIGRNGAGKSTLLKILSCVTAPTIGEIKIKGRIASLLEVGTGFHPELTGRENIYLNGAIMGMNRCEIQRKFNEIVDFSCIEKFIDTPVKRYSSGMYVRLGFAVAAHLEPEILIVDEVLAVGDTEFQKKCLGKMSSVAQEGRTVLFVSHNLAAVSKLCKKSVVLKGGKVSFEGDVESGINNYLEDADQVKGFADFQDKKSNLHQPLNIFSRLLSIKTLDENSIQKSVFKMGGCLKIMLRVEITDDRNDIELAISFRSLRETILGVLINTAEGFNKIQKGINDVEIVIPEINLMPGEYILGVAIFCQHQVDDSYANAISVDIVSDNLTGNYVDFNRFKEYGSIIRSNWKNLAEINYK